MWRPCFLPQGKKQACALKARHLLGLLSTSGERAQKGTRGLHSPERCLGQFYLMVTIPLNYAKRRDMLDFFNFAVYTEIV